MCDVMDEITEPCYTFTLSTLLEILCADLVCVHADRSILAVCQNILDRITGGGYDILGGFDDNMCYTHFVMCRKDTGEVITTYPVHIY